MKKCSLLILTFAFICIILAGAPAAFGLEGTSSKESDEKPIPLMKDIPKDKLVTPGVGLGMVKFGDNIQKVEKMLGRGKLTPQPEGFNNIQIIQLDYPEKGLKLQFSNSRLSIITVEKPGYATREGIQVGVDVGEVIRFLGTNYHMKKSLMDQSAAEDSAYDLFYELVSVKIKGRIVKELRIRTKKQFK